MIAPYEVLDRKRAGERWTPEDIQSVVDGALSGAWSEVQLGAFLMAAAIRGLDPVETDALTRAMLESGKQWALADDIPGLSDKHSTGGVGDKTSLIVGPLLAACGQPIVMLTGRGLGHSGGTADKLEAIDGLDLALDRARALRLLRETGLAIGVATGDIAPADRRLYALRDMTGTVECPSLIVSSILSKKLASGAENLVFDVKTGSGAFIADLEDSAALAQALVDTCSAFGRRAAALVTDMNQPLGRWAGNSVEVGESIECLSGAGPEDLRELSLALAETICTEAENGIDRKRLESTLDDGSALEFFERWAVAQGASPGWLGRWTTRRAPCELTVEARESGKVSGVETRRLGLLLTQAGAGRSRPDESVDLEVALEMCVRIGDSVEVGQPLCRLFLRAEDVSLAERVRDCFIVAETATPPALIHSTVRPSAVPRSSSVVEAEA